MCGIVGFSNFSENLTDEVNVIERMSARLFHRGPDASGTWFSECVAFGHRRLIVVDPNGGKQPMIRKRGKNNYVLVYNGELYNTEELRCDLKARGYSFEGWSDTEVLLNAYLEWGKECLLKLNGIFAFAVYDEQEKSLFLARDHIGVKPLFYCIKKENFIFASEIKALLEHPLLSPRIDSDGLAEIFVMGPSRTPGQGVFSGIYELKPGHCMTIDNDGCKIQQYWSLQSHSHEDDFEKTVHTVKELVTDAVKRQLITNVPLCFLLSGGLDSSAISAIAAKVFQQEKGERINTFSIDYAGNVQNFQANEFQPNADAPWAKKVSDYLNTRHSVCILDTPELVEALFPAVRARDLPGMTDVDSSLLLFSRWIKDHATVGLSGECADEVFGGYPWFYSSESTNTFPWFRKMEDRMKLYSPDLVDVLKPERYLEDRYQEAIDEVPKFEGDSCLESKKRELFYLNLTRWMPTLLDRKDRMSMQYGVELRVPFCDHRLVEYVWNIPWEMKNYRNREKGLLRQALTGLLPDDVLWRKKSPYPKTHNPTYIEAIRTRMLSMLQDNSSPILPFINKQAVKECTIALNSQTNMPWFGQLMNAPQLLAYLLQTNDWLIEYKITIE